VIHRCWHVGSRVSRPIVRLLTLQVRGFIAHGVSFIDSHLAHWRILFLIEGLPTILVGVAVLLFLPSTPHRSKCEC